MGQLPKQNQLLLPLLEALRDAGGSAKPSELYAAVAEKIALPNWLRELRALAGKAGEINLWERRLRNTRQYAATHGLIENDPKRRRTNVWELTDSGKKSLRNCKPGIVITVFTTTLGTAIWATAESALQFIDDSSIHLILTSPPYPLTTKKEYGNLDPQAHVEWLTQLASGWKDKLTDNGSLVLNLADAYNPGNPSISLYQERLLINLCDELGYSLAQKFYWENPAKMPCPAEWVCLKRIRTISSVEQIYWLTKNPHTATANNKNILRPYSASMRNRIAQGGEALSQKRPSGFKLKKGAFNKDNGGSIPHNLIIASHTESNDSYKKLSKERGLPIHPARFPSAIPAIFIPFLTNPGDITWDPMAGSGVTANIAEQLGRRWIINDRSLTYLQGAALRFNDNPSLKTYFHELAA